MSKKVFIKTFGCQMNEYDSDKMADVMKAAEGYEPTQNVDEADLILFNTCSVRERAQEKVFSDLGRVKHLKEKGVLIGVGGCVASQEGADIIKIHVTGSIPTRSGEIQVWTREELKVVCDTAHDLGVRVTAHCRGDKATLDAVMAGVDIIWHASFLGDAALEAIIDKKVPVGPVFTFLANLSEYGHKAGATSTAKSVFAGELEHTGSKLREAYDAGVKLLCGSESGFSMTPYGHWHAREMEVFVQHLGLTPLQAITCATKDNAVALDEYGETGCIASGYRADVLILDGDPSKNVSLLSDKSTFRHLFCRGKQVDLSPMPARSLFRGEQTSSWSEIALTREVALS